MNLPRRLFFTLLVIRHALLPSGHRMASGAPIAAHERDGEHFARVTPATVPSSLAALCDATAPRRSVSLFFPGCLSLAAPFLLFRLKRLGYSACRAVVTSEGLFLSGRR